MINRFNLKNPAIVKYYMEAEDKKYSRNGFTKKCDKIKATILKYRNNQPQIQKEIT